MGDFLELLKLPKTTALARYFEQKHTVYVIVSNYFGTVFSIQLERFDVRQQQWYTAMYCEVDRRGGLKCGWIGVIRDHINRLMTPVDLKQIIQTLRKDPQKFIIIERGRQ